MQASVEAVRGIQAARAEQESSNSREGNRGSGCKKPQSSWCPNVNTSNGYRKKKRHGKGNESRTST